MARPLREGGGSKARVRSYWPCLRAYKKCKRKISGIKRAGGGKTRYRNKIFLLQNFKIIMVNYFPSYLDNLCG